ncbi:hypothetical protein WJX84_001489, partial [Apatococcus fuscideae]
VLSIPTPEEILTRGLTPEDLPAYDERVDIWAVGILAYELLAAGRLLSHRLSQQSPPLLESWRLDSAQQSSLHLGLGQETAGRMTAGDVEGFEAPHPARSPLPSPRFSAHIRHNPLFNDDAPHGSSSQELSQAPSGKIPMAMDDGPPDTRLEQMLELSFSAPLPDQAGRTPTRFSGTGTAHPEPKRIARGSAPCSPSPGIRPGWRAEGKVLAASASSMHPLSNEDPRPADPRASPATDPTPSLASNTSMEVAVGSAANIFGLVGRAADVAGPAEQPAQAAQDLQDRGHLAPGPVPIRADVPERPARAAPSRGPSGNAAPSSEHPRQDRVMLDALFVAPHPLEIVSRHAAPETCSDEQLSDPFRLPVGLQRANSFNNRMRSWFLKRKA